MDCKHANSQYLKRYRIQSVGRPVDSPNYEYQKIAKAALDWIISNRPDVYEELRNGLANG